MTLRRAKLFIGKKCITKVPDGTLLSTQESPVSSILVKHTVDDEDNAYPHFLVEYDELSCQTPQADGEYDVFKVLPFGVELGPSRNVMCRCVTKDEVVGDDVRVILTTQNHEVIDLPLTEYETRDHGSVRVVKVVHDEYDNSVSFVIKPSDSNKFAGGPCVWSRGLLVLDIKN